MNLTHLHLYSELPLENTVSKEVQLVVLKPPGSEPAEAVFIKDRSSSRRVSDELACVMLIFSAVGGEEGGGGKGGGRGGGTEW